MKKEKTIYDKIMDRWYEITKIKDNEEYCKQLSMLFDELRPDDDNDFDIEQKLITTAEMHFTMKAISKETIAYQLEDASCYTLYFNMDSRRCSEDMHYKNIHAFYPESNLIERLDGIDDNTEYIVGGIEERKNIFDDEDFLFSRYSCCKGKNVEKYLKKYRNDKKKYVFSMADDVAEKITKRIAFHTICNIFNIEKNCFIYNENNCLKEKKHFEGDIIITDPCYIMRERDETTRPDWKDYCLHNRPDEYPDYNPETKKSELHEKEYELYREADKKWCAEHPDDRDTWDDYHLQNFGINTFLSHSTLYGDWSCHTFDAETKEPIGQFCADGGMVSVFLLDEVLKYNPDFDYHITKPFTTTWIKNFSGDVWFEQTDEDTLIVKGEGNVNFVTSQTGL